MKALRLTSMATTLMAVVPMAAVHAQPAPAAPSAPAVQQGPQYLAFTEADARAVLNARLAAIRTVMELTPEQERLW
ncbi:hypothetical protein [Roseomonas indoligenes]|uniref:Uncharacterized protein n=1 Tax=Roseomonas indoligenes TaxID=2820811 RepID=A0A940N818_9PROT|nr:hypothetical protein [Pararoseomonas indoligenes]MBP0495757.1 hypothetical protein [Pararoseomonas indoligenes]